MIGCIHVKPVLLSSHQSPSSFQAEDFHCLGMVLNAFLPIKSLLYLWKAADSTQLYRLYTFFWLMPLPSSCVCWPIMEEHRSNYFSETPAFQRRWKWNKRNSCFSFQKHLISWQKKKGRLKITLWDMETDRAWRSSLLCRLELNPWVFLIPDSTNTA